MHKCMYATRDASVLSYLLSLQLQQLDSLLFILTKSMTLHLVIDLLTKYTKETEKHSKNGGGGGMG